MRLTELDLNGKVAIVTGGSQGIGRAISLAFAKSGASVVVADVDETSAARLASEISASGPPGLPVKTDVRDGEQIEAMVERAVAEFGTIDILVNNAGGASGPNFRIGRILNISETDWDETVAVNVKSVFLCSRAAGKVMWNRKSGSIINMTSITATLPWAGMPAYSAAKAAVTSLTKSMAMEFAPHIRVNAIAPGLVETPRTSRNRRPEQLEQLLTNVPLQRMGQPEEIADIALYLASDAASWVTGNIVDCNGGQIWMARDGRPEFRDSAR